MDELNKLTKDGEKVHAGQLEMSFKKDNLILKCPKCETHISVKAETFSERLNRHFARRMKEREDDS